MSEKQGQNTVTQIVSSLRIHQTYLFQRDGFEVAYTATSGRYESEAIVGLSNGRMQLLFHRPNIPPRFTICRIPYVGTLDESRENERILNKWWIAPTWFFCFVDDIMPVNNWRDFDRTLLLQQTWDKLRTRLPEIAPMFESKATMQQWMPGYVRYLIQIDLIVQRALREWVEESEGD